MLVITEDLGGAPRIEIGERGAPPAYLEDFVGEAPLGVVTPNPLQTLLGGPAHSGGHALAGERGKLANGFLGGRVFYVQRHDCLAENFCQ